MACGGLEMVVYCTRVCDLVSKVLCQAIPSRTIYEPTTTALGSDKAFDLHIPGAVQLLLLERFHQAQEERSQTETNSATDGAILHRAEFKAPLGTQAVEVW